MHSEFEIINMYLNDIKGYVTSAITYLKYPNDYMDKEEIIAYASTIPEIIEDIKRKLEKIEIRMENDKNE